VTLNILPHYSPAYTFAGYLALGKAADEACERGDHDATEELGALELDHETALLTQAVSSRAQAIDLVRITVMRLPGGDLESELKTTIGVLILAALADLEVSANSLETVKALRRARDIAGPFDGTPGTGTDGTIATALTKALTWLCVPSLVG